MIRASSLVVVLLGAISVTACTSTGESDQGSSVAAVSTPSNWKATSLGKLGNWAPSNDATSLATRIPQNGDVLLVTNQGLQLTPQTFDSAKGLLDALRAKAKSFPTLTSAVEDGGVQAPTCDPESDDWPAPDGTKNAVFRIHTKGSAAKTLIDTLAEEANTREAGSGDAYADVAAKIEAEIFVPGSMRLFYSLETRVDANNKVIKDAHGNDALFWQLRIVDLATGDCGA